MEWMKGHFCELYAILEPQYGSKEACKKIEANIKGLMESNPEKGVVIDLRGANLGDDDILTTIAKIRLAAGDDNNRVILDGACSGDEEYQLSYKLYQMTGKKIVVTFREDAS